MEEGDIECHTLPPPVVPTIQSMPQQESGVRRSRALPYEFYVHDEIYVHDASKATVSLILSVNNTGLAGAPFVLFDVANIATINPRQYAIDSKKDITDSIPLTVSSNGIISYDYSLFGANGFVRQFTGIIDTTSLAASSRTSCSTSKALHAHVSLRYDYDISTGSSAIVLLLTNKKSSNTCIDLLTFVVTDNAYGLLHGEVKKVVVNSGQTIEYRIDTTASGNWYDLSITVDDASDEVKHHVSDSIASSTSSSYFRRFMGRFETGQDSISDPAMGQGLHGLWNHRSEDQHPLIPTHMRHLQRVETKHAEFDKDAKFYDDSKSEL